MLKVARKTGNFGKSAVKLVEPATQIAESGTVCGIQ